MQALATNPMVVMVLQLGAGYMLKKWPKFPNKLIPVANYLLALVGFTILPTPAEAAGLATVAGQFGNVFTASLVQTLVTTGTHSTWKNVIGQFVMNWFGRKG